MSETPKGYIVGEIDVHDPAGFADYRNAVTPLLEHFGGRYIARGGTVIGMEGDAPRGRIVMIEFPSAAMAEAFLRSPEYAPIGAIRHRTSASRLFVVEGVDL